MITPARLLFLGGLLALLVAGPVSADAYDLTGVPPDYLGVWAPKAFLDVFRETANYAASQPPRSEARPHDVLVLEPTHLWADAGFHDGYAVPQDDFSHYRFETRNGTRVMTDQVGNEYELLGPGTRATYPQVYASALLTVLKDTLTHYSPYLAVEVRDHDLAILSGKPAFGPLVPLLDLFPLQRYDGALSGYQMYFRHAATGEVFGLRLDEAYVELDEFDPLIELAGQTIQRSEIRVVPRFVLR